MGLLERLADIEEIKKLRNRYCYLVDERKWAEVAELFTEDGVADYGGMGSYRGREEIRKFFENTAGKLMTFSGHFLHNPIIEVDGDSATGEWYMTSHGTVKGNRAVWILLKAFDKYQRVGNVWKMKSFKYDWKYYTPFEDGWAKTPFFTP